MEQEEAEKEEKQEEMEENFLTFQSKIKLPFTPGEKAQATKS